MNGVVLLAALVALARPEISPARQEELRRQLLSSECRRPLTECESRCNRTHDRALADIAIEESTARLAHSRALVRCRTENLGNPRELDRCIQAETGRFSVLQQGFDGRRGVAGETHQGCLEGCRAEADRCQADEQRVELPGRSVPFEVACIDGGAAAPCFKRVDELCQRIAGACDACATALCGAARWSFSAEGLERVVLTASTDSSQRARTLATSHKGASIFLNVPRKITLAPGERLLLAFEFKGGAQGRSTPVVLGIER